MVFQYPDFRTLPDIEEKVHDFVMELPCRAPGDYPSAEIAGVDKEYADVLLDAFADGGAAELTAIAQYFQHALTIPEHAVSNLELCTALTEMHHLDLIGEMIESLGGTPKYWRTNRHYWSGGNVGYGDSTPAKLLLDIQAEREAVAAYERLLEQIDNAQVRAVIERILADELVHLQLFQDAYESVASPGHA
jgi:bacterioferritin